MGEHPTRALSQKPNSSIGIGFTLLKEGKADIFASAGNTGAMMVGSLFSVKTIEGIQRPAIAGFIPQTDGTHSVMLDIGANADCKPEMLAQWAVLGSAYAAATRGIESPRVGLLNIGEEEQKGSTLTQATYALLKANEKLNFVGNLEGKDIFRGKADVIVTDGFTGNIVLKMGESIYNIMKEQGMVNEFVDRTNYENYGGSPIIGINGNVIIYTDCRPIIVTEIDNRRKRPIFDSFINHHIEYQPYINIIYTRCFPTGNVQVAKPPVGWTIAEAVRDKYYFDEIFFYLHMHVSNLYSITTNNMKSRVTRSSKQKCSNSTDQLANNSNKTSTLMIVLTDRLKMYLKPNTL
jgi:hypothetical protein